MVEQTDIIKIKITKKLRTEAETLGKARNEKSKRFGQRLYSETSKIKSGNETHYLGVIAELTVAKYFSIEMNKEIYDSHGDCGHDLIIPGLGKTELKTTTYVNDPFLRAELKKDHEGIDNYLLVAVDDDYAYIIGYIPRSELILLKPRKLLKFGPVNYIATTKELYPIKGIK